MSHVEQTAAFWDTIDDSRPLQFWDLPVVQRYRKRLISGREDQGALAWFKERYVPRPCGRAISLGCGTGALERRAVKLGIAGSLTGVDIAPARLALARQKADGMPIRYLRANINALQLEENSFDCGLCKTILHHIAKLEHVVTELKKALQPGALLYVDDYIGPSRFQFSEHMLRIGDQVLGEIPVELRRQGPGNTSVKTSISRISPEIIVRSDPSEAIRSDEVERLLKKEFTLLAERNSGGSLLFRLLDGIAHNFDADCREHNQVLKVLCSFEERMMQKHLLPAIFKVYVFRNDT